MNGVDVYEIRVKEQLGHCWAEWLEELDIRHDDNGQTVITGPLRDQAALHGVLSKIRDLGLTLIEVKIIVNNQ